MHVVRYRRQPEIGYSRNGTRRESAEERRLIDRVFACELQGSVAVGT